MPLTYLDLDALEAAPLTRTPFQYLVIPGFVRAPALTEINRDYPKIAESGSFPADQLAYGPAFRAFLDELASDAVPRSLRAEIRSRSFRPPAYRDGAAAAAARRTGGSIPTRRARSSLS